MKFAINCILVTTDLSDLARKALSYAAAFAGEFGAVLYVLHVIEPPPFVSGLEATPLATSPTDERATVRRELIDWIRSASPTPVRIEPVVREGEPIAEIVAAASELKIDLIVISAHGRGGLRRVLLGSTAEHVLRRAPCPVMVVRPGDKDLHEPGAH